MFQCASDAVPGNTLDNPAYESATVGENAEQASASPQREDPQILSPSDNFDNPVYGMPEGQQLEATQHQPHSEHLQNHAYVYGNEPLPMHKDVSYKQRHQLNNGNVTYTKTESRHPETLSSPPDVEFQNILYEPSDRAAI